MYFGHQNVYTWEIQTPPKYQSFFTYLLIAHKPGNLLVNRIMHGTNQFISQHYKNGFNIQLPYIMYIDASFNNEELYLIILKSLVLKSIKHPDTQECLDQQRLAKDTKIILDLKGWTGECSDEESYTGGMGGGLINLSRPEKKYQEFFN